MFDPATASSHHQDEMKVDTEDATMQVSCSEDEMSIASTSIHRCHADLDSSEPQQQPQQRAVRFSVVEEFEYENPEYTEEEVATLWYTMEEMVGLVKHEMKLCQDQLTKECSWRGLEHMQGGVDTRADRVADVIDAILDAYDELSYESEDDVFSGDDARDEALRAECRAVTREDRKRAYKYGLRDASVAEQIYQAATTTNSNSAPPKKQSSRNKPNHRGMRRATRISDAANKGASTDPAMSSDEERSATAPPSQSNSSSAEQMRITSSSA